MRTRFTTTGIPYQVSAPLTHNERERERQRQQRLDAFIEQLEQLLEPSVLCLLSFRQSQVFSPIVFVLALASKHFAQNASSTLSRLLLSLIGLTLCALSAYAAGEHSGNRQQQEHRQNPATERNPLELTLTQITYFLLAMYLSLFSNLPSLVRLPLSASVYAHTSLTYYQAGSRRALNNHLQEDSDSDTEEAALSVV